MACKSCGGKVDPMAVYEIPPQPSAPRPVEPQTMQGQAPYTRPVLVPDDPKPARSRRSSRKSGE